MSFSLKLMHPSLEDETLKFLADNFGSSSIQCNKGRFYWITKQYPNDSKVYLCFDRQRIAGYSCFLPVNISLEGAVFRAAFSIDTMVAARYRRKGIGRIFHEKRLQEFDIALSSGQSPSNAQLYRKMGWHIIDEYFDFRLVKKFPKFHNLKTFIRDCFLLLLYRARSFNRRRSTKSEIVTSFPGSENIPKARGLDSEAFVIFDEAYIPWRFKAHPYYLYNMVLIHENNVPIGLCVVRENEPGNFKLVDLFGRRERLPALLAGIADSIDCCSIEGQMIGSAFRQEFVRSGFRVTNTSQYLVGASLDLNLSDLIRKREWLIFGSDSDNDR